MDDKSYGHVVSVNVSEKKGTIKKSVSEITLSKTGVLGDAHSGDWHRQVSLLSMERIDQFSLEAGRRIKPGEFAENITTRGIDIRNAAILDRIKIGSAELEVTQIGKVCHGNTCAIYQEVGACIMPKEGVFCRVVQEGTVKEGDTIDYHPVKLRCLVLTLSDRAHEGKRPDTSGPRINEMLEFFFHDTQWNIECTRIILPDDERSLRREIEKALDINVDIIITTGGTGIGPRDITPDVVGSLVDKTIPGIMEHIRMKYGEKNPRALLSRSVAGLIGKCIVYTLPGSEKAVKEYMTEILKTMEHCIFMVRGIDVHHV